MSVDDESAKLNTFYSRLRRDFFPPKRVLWILNHKTLLPAEVGILRSLGFAVFVPKIVPQGWEYGNTFVGNDHDAGLFLERNHISILNNQNFYSDRWSIDVEDLINRNFDVLVTSVYKTPLMEAVNKFQGTVVARVFGRETPRNYTELFESYDCGLLEKIASLGNRFMFGQGYDNLAGIEDRRLADRAHALLVAIPESIWSRKGTWTGAGPRAVLLLSPKIGDVTYYEELYRAQKSMFKDVPHQIFGRQYSSVDDPAVLPYLSDDGLLDLYAKSPVFAYTSTEPRHLHYSPIEAMIVGTPVLYRSGSMIDFLAGAELTGRCADPLEMRENVIRILNGDRDLANAIRSDQEQIIQTFSTELARRQWKDAIGVGRMRWLHNALKLIAS